jgi:FdrA protein
MTAVELPRLVRSAVLSNMYRDSVELMRIAAELEALPGVHRAALMMGTAANHDVLRAADLLGEDMASAGPNDLVVAIAGDVQAVEAAESRARALLAGQSGGIAAAPGQTRAAPRSLSQAAAELPGANLALISTPGAYATAEALKALKRGMDVFLFSDNVSIADEIELKALAKRRGRLLMGPDCGTAILEGIPLGFANAVQPGCIGLAGASGTGLQQVACLVDRLGEGVSHAIGVGGRDLDERVGGSMMLAALERLAADASTRVIVLISKPPAPVVAQRVLEAARTSGKPVVVNFLGDTAREGQGDGLVHAATLEAAAQAAVALARGEPPRTMATLDAELIAAAASEARMLRPEQRRIVGLFSGGTLCKEAALVLHELWPNGDCRLIDLGDDEFTVGRPHPMIDARLRSERIVEVGADPSAAVLLLDVVLGYGSHADPAGALAPSIVSARQAAAGGGRRLTVVASVCGTPADPQGLADQERKVAEAGVLLAPSNAQAARLAGLIAGAQR